MTPIKLRIAVALLVLQAYMQPMAPQPPCDEGWTCGSCQSWNESFRTTCRNCGGG